MAISGNKKKNKEDLQMANKIKTRVDNSNPNKNKVATLIGYNKPEQFYQDLLEFKLELNGIEMPIGKLLEKLFDKLETDEKHIRDLAKEVSLLKEQNKLLLEAVKKLDTRLYKLENLGNL
jgi:predicted  nucleic acid-binding Zn-ribbon protein